MRIQWNSKHAIISNMRCVRLCKAKRNERYVGIISSRIIFQVDCFYVCAPTRTKRHMIFFAHTLVRGKHTQQISMCEQHSFQFYSILFSFSLFCTVHGVCLSFKFFEACNQKQKTKTKHKKDWMKERKTKTHQTNTFVGNHGNSK